MKTYQENEMFCLLEFGKNTLIETQKTELIADNKIYCMIESIKFILRLRRRTDAISFS